MRRSTVQPGGHDQPHIGPVGMPSKFANVPAPVRLVRIVWHDAWHVSAGEWFDPDVLDPVPCECITVGLLIRESPDAVLIAHTVQEDGDCTGGFVIPRANIVSMETLAVPD